VWAGSPKFMVCAPKMFFGRCCRILYGGPLVEMHALNRREKIWKILPFPRGIVGIDRPPSWRVRVRVLAT
jgi:hypothetical protein